jgi:hypothetical protein
MAYPTPIIEIAFDDGPYVVSPTWTDVTAYCRGFETSRGVPDDWTLQADGSATVTLSNRDRRFDPFNTAGPYYGKLLPRRQIRIRASDLSGLSPTIYDVFRGFVSGWPPEWTDAGYDSTVTLSCFDALQLLGSSSMPADWAMPYIQSLDPRHYWEMDDPVNLYAGSFYVNDRGNTASILKVDPNTCYQGDQISLGLPSHSIGTEFGSISSLTFPVTTVAPNTTSSFTMTMWTVASSATVAGSVVSMNFAGGSLTAGFSTDTTGSTYGEYSVLLQEPSRTSEWKSTSFVQPSEPHHIAFTHDVNTNVGKLYIDGVDVTSAKTNSGGSAVGAGETFQFTTGNFQQIALFTSVLTQAQIQEIVRLGEGQYPETSSARVSRIIGNTPYSMSLVSTPSTPASDVLSLTPDAPTAAGELTKVSDSEYAPLFVSKSGVLTLFGQNQIRANAVNLESQVTYGAGGVSIGTEVQLQYDGDSMRNIANVEMSYGGVYIDENTTSVNTYGEAEQFVTTQVAAYSDAFAIGDIVTGWGSQVYPKASPVSVVLSPDGSWGSTLGLELFSRFTLAVAPPTGATITTPMLLSRISHSVTPERWTTTVEGSARWAAVFILNQSRLDGTDLLG